MQHGIRFLPTLVSIVVHITAQTLGIYPQIPHTQRLKEKPVSPQIVHQVVRAKPQGGSRYRRIHEMPGIGCSNSRFRPQIRVPRRKIFYDEQFLHDVNVRRNGVLAERICLVGQHIGPDGGVSCPCSRMPCVRTQKPGNALSASAYAIDFREVRADKIIVIVDSLRKRDRLPAAYRLGPSTSAQSKSQILQRKRSFSEHLMIAVEKSRKRHLST